MRSMLLLLLVVAAHGSDVTRDFFGDIFRMRDCHNGSRCDNGGRRPAQEVPGRPCFCQCAPTHLAFREDKQQCVKDIRECYMSVFYRPFTVEAIPLVYLPTSGQLVHPDAHLSLSGRKSADAGFPTCKAAVSQYLTRDGWRTLTKVDNGGGPVFGLFADANKTFLQFLGNANDRRVLQQHLALIRLFCRIPDYSPFETCVAIRVGWVPGVDSIEETEATGGRANMMVVGLSLGVLGLVYVFAVLVYLKIRRQLLAKQKTNNDQEAKLQEREDAVDKVSSLHRLEASSRLELYHTSSLSRPKHGSLRGVPDPWSQISPIVETYNRSWTDRMGQHGCEFRAQDLKLQPEFFEPELLASPPQQVLEYLERLQNSVTFARHRLRSCYRYQPTLIDIPEDDYFYQELENKACSSKEQRTTPDGGSASSVGSIVECSEQDGVKVAEAPKIPPRKPKRKNRKSSGSKENEQKPTAEQEQKEIQNAMNTLNDTLDALEMDIFKHELLQQTSDSDNLNISCNNSTSADIDDFDTSSCSSLSAVTVLGRDIKRQTDLISPDNGSVEKNLSEEFSTFSNSTFSLAETMPGLFNDGNKASNSNESPPDTPKEEFSLFSGKPEVIVEKKHVEANFFNNDDDSQELNMCQEGNRNLRTPIDSLERELSNVERNYIPITLDSLEREHRDSDSEKCHALQKSSSTESMNTISTEMTSDSLDSRPSSPNPTSPTPSLVDMWISRLVQSSSVPYTKSRRKSKKKLVLPEDEIDNWEHVCQKHKAPCPMHALNDAEPNLIDKLAHYSSKTMAGCDVAGYFQSLKQDVLKEHLKSLLSSGGQGKKNRKSSSVKHKKNECSHKRPLVNGQELNSFYDNSPRCTFSSFKPVDTNDLKQSESTESNLNENGEKHTFKTDQNQNKIGDVLVEVNESAQENILS